MLPLHPSLFWRSTVTVSFPVMCRRLYGCVGKSRTGREDKKELLFVEEHPELLTYCLQMILYCFVRLYRMKGRPLWRFSKHMQRLQVKV